MGNIKIYASIALGLLCIAAVIFQGCEDPTYDDLGGNLTLKGKVSLLSLTATQQEPSILKNKEVFIQYADKGDADYLYSVKSDVNGNFVFNNLKAEEYLIFCSETKDSIVYRFSGKFMISAQQESVNVVLGPDSLKQNLLLVRTTDVANETIPGAKILLYSSKVIADADTGFTGSGAILNATSSLNGALNRTGFTPGKYYLRSQLRIIGDTLRTASVYETTVNSKGISRINLVLK